MTRSRLPLLALALAAAFSAPVAAQTVGFNIRTGDVWVDNRLGEINQYGHHYRDPFVRELTGHYGAPRALVLELLDQRRWAPADVYYACAIAHVLGRPCIEVVREYDRAPGQGWGEVAKRMGIKPGSREFHALKRGTVATYDRWGHPVVIDRDVRVDWSKHGPGHGRAGHGGHDARASSGKGKPAHAGHAGDSKGGKGQGNRSNGSNRHEGGKGKGEGKGKGKD